MSLETSFHLIIERLEYNRSFPKYQFERSLDAFLSLFIEEYLSAVYQAEVVYVAAEFPLRREGNNQSTNVDYLLLRKGSSPAWLFVELKTDKNSENIEQLIILNDLVNRSFSCLREDIKRIRDNSKQKAKYDYLLDAIQRKWQSQEDFNFPIEPIFLTNYEPSLEIREEFSNIKWISLSEFDGHLSNTKHPEMWSIVRTLCK